MGRGGGWYREIAPINGRFPQSAIRRLLWFCRPVFIPLLFFRLFFFFFYCPFLKQNEKQGRLAGEWLSVTEPRISRDFRFRKHAWFKWYPCNLIALFVNDICYARIISPWPVVLVPFFFFFFPGNGIGKFGISMDETFFFFFFFDTSFREFGDSILQHGPLSRIMTKFFFFFSFVTGKSNRAIGWQSMVNICPKKKELKKNIVKLLFRFNIEEIII